MNIDDREYWSQVAGETNMLTDPTLHQRVDRSAGFISLSDPQLVRIVRLRLIGWERSMPQWDVSYCYGEMADGRIVDVDIPGPIDTRYKGHLVDIAREAGRYAKGIGLIDNDVISLLPG